jgi:hypothetical protein
MPASTMPRRARRAPRQRDEDEQIDRRVFEEVDAVGEQRNRADRERDREFHAEIGEIEQCNHEDGAAQR